MNHQRKAFLRREMLACAQQVHAERKYGTEAEAQKWSDLAAKRLAELGGLAGNW